MKTLDDVAKLLGQLVENGCLSRQRRMDLWQQASEAMQEYRKSPEFERAILSRPFRVLWSAVDRGLAEAFVKSVEEHGDENPEPGE